MDFLTRIRNKKTFSLLLLAVLLIVVFVVVRGRGPSKSKKDVVTQEATKAKASAEINKSFEFQAINIAKKEKPVSFTITTIERKDEIKVKNEARRTTSDKDYLLVRIELENTQPEKLAIATADYIRLEDKAGKKYAPDYHNGAVVIDPIAVRKDLVAFVVTKKQKDFVLYVGELQGEKQRIEVIF